MSFSTRASPEGHWPCRSTAYGRSRLDRSGSEPVAPRARCLPSRPGPHFGVPATVPQRCPAREEGMMERQAAAAMSRRAACGRRWSRLGCRRWRAVRAKGQILKATRRRAAGGGRWHAGEILPADAARASPGRRAALCPGRALCRSRLFRPAAGAVRDRDGAAAAGRARRRGTHHDAAGLPPRRGGCHDGAPSRRADRRAGGLAEARAAQPRRGGGLLVLGRSTRTSSPSNDIHREGRAPAVDRPAPRPVCRARQHASRSFIPARASPTVPSPECGRRRQAKRRFAPA